MSQSCMHKYVVPNHLRFERIVGAGATGTVAAFFNTTTNTQVAVKKVSGVFRDLIDAKRILREVKILRQLNHENIIKVLDILPPPETDIRDLYIISELMETDLHKVIYSKQSLTDQHVRFFSYQLIRGLAYLHSRGVLHRDLKPSNILLDLNCDLKICDFGLARAMSSGTVETAHQEDQALTDYVVTRWYRAPEIILGCQRYDYSVDLWSAGCVLAEIIARKVLFAGKDHLNQIEQILSVLGTPSDDDLLWLPRTGPSANARRFLDALPRRRPSNFKTLFPNVSAECSDLLSRLLAFDPEKRITAREALRHPYFRDLHSPEDEAFFGQQHLTWDFDTPGMTKSDLQLTLYAEAAVNYPEIVVRDFDILASRGFTLPPDTEERMHLTIQRRTLGEQANLMEKVSALGSRGGRRKLSVDSDDLQTTSQSTAASSGSLKGGALKRKRDSSRRRDKNARAPRRVATLAGRRQ